MKRLTLTTLLVAASLSASASGSRDTVSLDGNTCPADTVATGGPSYAWNGSRFVFEGWICEDKYRGTSIGN